MEDVYICKSCGKVMRNAEDFSRNEFGADYCKACSDEFGYRRTFSQVIRETSSFVKEQLSVSEPEAKKIAVENISKIPLWMNRADLIRKQNHILIVDVGSTTTKGLLLKRSDENFEIAALQNSPTTVEKPDEDVKIGILSVIDKLQKNSGIKLFGERNSRDLSNLSEDVLFLCTSSAGGGLQILVIGLTLFDSASSGRRTAFGAGGVILDTLAIDDKRSSLEQMMLMRLLHPDIILMAGGVDGGAIAPLLRLGEILQIADPKPKFGDKQKIPLIFAGNKDARSFIGGLFKNRFDLYIVPNIRPSMKLENLQPAREKIHNLFMDNVMEQSPGYSALKEKVADDIIPTPLGVIRSLQIISDSLDENVISVDIGGATTDIFSNILGTYNRTVSANYGMSYSISNVFKDAGLDRIRKWLPDRIGEDYLRNYIGNKMLYPAYIPSDNDQVAVEMSIAREAIRLSKIQHLEMNFNTKEIGFLDKITKNRQDLEKITEAFYIEKALEAKKFHFHEINIMIGAGGAISHAQSNEQALAIIVDGFSPQGITEIWKDIHFLTPHLGKLSSIDEETASRLLKDNCFEKIALVIRPVSDKWKPEKPVLSMTISEDDSEQTWQIKTGDLKWIPAAGGRERTITIQLEKGFYLNDDSSLVEIKSELPVYLDARIEPDWKTQNQALKLLADNTEEISLETSFADMIPELNLTQGIFTLDKQLPYAGRILVKPGDSVTPESIIGENIYDPPRLYVISLFDKTYLKLNKDNLSKSLLIKEGDEVKTGQRVVEIGSGKLKDELTFQHFYFESPIRGRVEKINYDSGTIILREIQDYSLKPRKINLAKKLNIKPNLITRYLKRNLNEFVYTGECLASKIMDAKTPVFINSPTTGRIIKIDTAKGEVIIKYDKKPFRLKADLTGKISAVEEGISARIEYNGFHLQGIIGFGPVGAGSLQYIDPQNRETEFQAGNILVFPGKINCNLLRQAESSNCHGVICASIDNRELTDFIGDEIGVALTGNEPIPFPVIILKGFGDFELNPEERKFFKSKQGKWTYLDGHTQIRAGVVRAQINILED